MVTEQVSHRQLKRELGLPGAIMMGLGSMIGTGVFVSIGLGAGIAGPAVVLAVALAAPVAVANGLSSAQLAASHPVSGGTYEYGYRYLRPWLGFAAGWMFLVAKSASAATAALGLAGYVIAGLALPPGALVPLALATVAALTILVLSGLRRSNAANTAIVSFTLIALVVFVLVGVGAAAPANFRPFMAPAAEEAGPLAALFHATALMFVAYTGYGRIATMGEEVRAPQVTIPRAIIIVMIVTAILYVAVTAAAVGVVGAGPLYEATVSGAAPLTFAARVAAGDWVARLLAVAAITAMLGVLLNLVLGLSRVLLAMGRRGDMPAAVARLNERGTTPYVAVLLVGLAIGGLVLLGSVKTTWSFSAFTVLLYYSITNLAALRLPAEQRRFPAWVSAAGLLASLFLAFWVEPQTWLVLLGLLAAGLLWHALRRRATGP